MKQFVLALALMLLPGLAFAQMPDVRALAKVGFHNPKRALAFIEKLRAAVRADDAPAIAKMLNNTFSFIYDGQEHAISPEVFIKDYPNIINSDVRKAILEGDCTISYRDALGLSYGRAIVYTAGNGGTWQVMSIILSKE